MELDFAGAGFSVICVASSIFTPGVDQGLGAVKIAKAGENIGNIASEGKVLKNISKTAKLGKQGAGIVDIVRGVDKLDAFADAGRTASHVADGVKTTENTLDATKSVDNVADAVSAGNKVSSGSGGTKLYHSADESVVDLIKENGFKTDLPTKSDAFHNNRFGRGVYLADSPTTALAERPGGVIIEVEATLGKNLDITTKGIIDYETAHSIARGARKHGYNSITFRSAK